MRGWRLSKRARRLMKWYLHHEMGPGELIWVLVLGFSGALILRLILWFQMATTPTVFG